MTNEQQEQYELDKEKILRTRSRVAEVLKEEGVAAIIFLAMPGIIREVDHLTVPEFCLTRVKGGVEVDYSNPIKVINTYLMIDHMVTGLIRRAEALHSIIEGMEADGVVVKIPLDENDEEQHTAAN